MPASVPFLIATLPAVALATGADDVRILFAGDILLGRQVRREIDATGRDPLREVRALLSGADVAGGNLEGAVGACGAGELCFDLRKDDLALLSAAGFDLLSLENNHAGDTGPDGRAMTESSVRALGLEPLTLERSPVFVHAKGWTIAFVAFSEVPARDGHETGPSAELARKLRLARALANVVVVSVHWGEELFDWPSARQRRDATWLVEHGADVVMGHHPHVVQAPECVGGKPVFFSLGNHLFDQKYPATKVGLLADCRIEDGVLRCGGIETRTPPGSASPAIVGRDDVADRALALCPCDVNEGLAVGDRTLEPEGDGLSLSLVARERGRREWRTPEGRLLEASAVTLPSGTLLYTLEEHASTIDGERAPRPYVYRVTATGLSALWRGSALAWPLVDAVAMPDHPGCLCALHRGDSFLELDPRNRERRTAVYRWNGFGFDVVRDAAVEARCREIFAP
ncbi:MAG: CapA family protein [Acidobacteriota bacterium]